MSNIRAICNCCSRSCRFTVIEMLVVIAILSILASFLLPALTSAKNAAMSLSCSNNQRQLFHGFILYSEDWHGAIPSAWSTVSWNKIIYPYLFPQLLQLPGYTPIGSDSYDYQTLNIGGMFCPSVPNLKGAFTTYAMNACAGGRSWTGYADIRPKHCNMRRITNPSQIYLVGEKNPQTYNGGYQISPWNFSGVLTNYTLDSASSNYAHCIALRHDLSASWMFFDGHVKIVPSVIVMSWSAITRGRTLENCYF